MNLLDSLLDAMIRLEGDALVMHVGEKPYVVTTSEAAGEFRGPLAWGHVELSSRVLTSEAMMRMLAQILPGDERAALDEYGAIEYDLASASSPHERFRLVAARGGDDIWLEIRRRPQAVSVAPRDSAGVVSTAPVEAAAAAVAPPEAAQPAADTVEAAPPAREQPESPAVVNSPDAAQRPIRHEEPAGSSGEATVPPVQEEEITLADQEFVPEHLLTPDAEWGDEVMTEGELVDLLRTSATMQVELVDGAPGSDDGEAEISLNDALAAASRSEVEQAEEPHAAGEGSAPPGLELHEPQAEIPAAHADAADVGRPWASSEMSETLLARPDVEPTLGGTSEHTSPFADPVADGEQEKHARARPALVVSLTRHLRSETGDVKATVGTLERFLRLAAGRGAAAVYVVAQSPPMVRVDGEFSVLDGEPPFTAQLVERLVAELGPQATDDTSSDSGEWTVDVQEIGRVRCTTFRDHRGPGLILRIVPQRAISADQLALPAEIQGLCSEADGLVLVSGGRASGKSTLLTSFVDLINRTRSDHVITTESQIDFVHENKRSFISQREIRGDADALAAALRAACREDPDVLVIDDLRTPDLVTLALEAAQVRLVFASIPAASTTSAIDRIIEMFPPERREKMQGLLASTLRGVVCQVLLRKLRGGRAAAREILFNTPAVANLILEGKTFQLPAAMESGRRFGMMSLAESLAGLVREGTVHPSHAYRKAPNREQFLALLRRDGIDTSIAERLA